MTEAEDHGSPEIEIVAFYIITFEQLNNKA